MSMARIGTMIRLPSRSAGRAPVRTHSYADAREMPRALAASVTVMVRGAVASRPRGRFPVAERPSRVCRLVIICSSRILRVICPTGPVVSRSLQRIPEGPVADVGRSELRPDATESFVLCKEFGWVATERQLLKWWSPEGEAGTLRDQAIKRRIYPDEFAQMVLFLASDDGAACTAQEFLVDGGRR